jgi:hypothetical protein
VEAPAIVMVQKIPLNGTRGVDGAIERLVPSKNETTIGGLHEKAALGSRGRGEPALET